MDIVGEEQGRLERAATWLQATPVELAGLAVLLVGAVVATGALWWTVAGAASPPAEVDGIEALVGPDGELAPGTADGADHHDGDGPTGALDGGPEQLVVHVTGAVGTPGVVTVRAGDRVADALTAAGGALDDAELDRLNLARPVTDGEQIHVPVEGEELPPEASRPDDAGGAGPVDLNRADAATLETLPGIGPARAAAIVEHRETHGPFTEPGDLRDVPGIGEATFQRLADQVTTS